ncbi:MAG: DUF3179 domain-containing protein [Candidatus Promineifilaceae bacterium]|nr:DUF3179 domain-containing protein [Candidatus Promineifilaceae bacterium]
MNQWSRLVIAAVVLMVAITLPVYFVLSGDGRSSNQDEQAILLPAPPHIDEDELDTLLAPDAIQAIDDPQFEAAGVVQDIDPDERIIGVEINGDARAYPLTILSTHEIVNDKVGGESLAVTWCPLCYSALVFDRQIDGRLISFGVSGKLLQNSLSMFDRETGSLWSQLYGGAIDGELAGTSLAVFPSVLIDWESWLAENPDGRVLSKQLTCAQFDCGTYASNPRGSYAVDPYASYYLSADEGVVNRQIPRDEFSRESKERVLGVRVNGIARAYPFSLSIIQPVINDEIAGVPVVIWFNPSTLTGTAYRREIDGKTLTFLVEESDPALMRDSETDSRWRGSSGKAVSGTYDGKRLSPLISTPAFSFGWYGYFPQSDTYAADTSGRID